MPDSRPTATWHSGDAYERYMGRWSRRLAPQFVAWLAAPPGLRWLDVGCGTGALSQAVLDACAPGSLAGADPSEGFLATARERLGARVALHCAPAGRLPLPDGVFDRAVSCLVLNFVPDAPAALREMARVTAPGGTVAACVWDYGGRMDLIRHYWDAASEVDPRAASQDQGERFAICRPDTLAAAFEQAGLVRVETTALELPMPFTDFDDYWRPFLGGQGPAPAHAMALDAATRERVRERLRARLPAQPDGSIALHARAWAACGVVR